MSGCGDSPSATGDGNGTEQASSLAEEAFQKINAAEPMRSVHTSNFPQLLDQLGISLLVSTYQAGRLVALRADSGVLNTHFRIFNKPMGLAVAGGRLAIGTAREIWEYHNLPAVAHKLEPVGKHDAAFLPRTCHVTGDIHIHEMAWGVEGPGLRVEGDAARVEGLGLRVEGNAADPHPSSLNPQPSTLNPPSGSSTRPFHASVRGATSTVSSRAGGLGLSPNCCRPIAAT